MFLSQIVMGHSYLKKVVKMRFPELRARAAAREAEAAARQVRRTNYKPL